MFNKTPRRTSDIASDAADIQLESPDSKRSSAITSISDVQSSNTSDGDYLSIPISEFQSLVINAEELEYAGYESHTDDQASKRTQREQRRPKKKPQKPEPPSPPMDPPTRYTDALEADESGAFDAEQVAKRTQIGYIRGASIVSTGTIGTVNLSDLGGHDRPTLDLLEEEEEDEIHF